MFTSRVLFMWTLLCQDFRFPKRKSESNISKVKYIYKHDPGNQPQLTSIRFYRVSLFDSDSAIQQRICGPCCCQCAHLAKLTTTDGMRLKYQEINLPKLAAICWHESPGNTAFPINVFFASLLFSFSVSLSCGENRNYSILLFFVERENQC